MPEKIVLPTPEPSQTQKVAYFTNLMFQRRDAAKIMRVWSAGRVLWERTPSPDGILRWEPKDKSWRNVAQHQLVVAAFARKVGQLFQLPNNELEDLTTAGLTHDTGKRLQKEHYLNPIANLSKQNAMNEQIVGKTLYEQFDRSEEASDRLLRATGFSPRVRLLAKSVGHTSLDDIANEMTAFLQQGTEPDWAKIILHWADDVVQNDKPVGLSRISDLANGKGTSAVYQKMNEYGREVSNDSLYERQFEIGESVDFVLKSVLKQRGQPIPGNVSLTNYVYDLMVIDALR